jgi:hypothetical protein
MHDVTLTCIRMWCTSHPTAEHVRRITYAAAYFVAVQWHLNTKILEIPGYWGDWYAKSYCGANRWVYGWLLRNEQKQDQGDDTSLNRSALRLVCSIRTSLAALFNGNTHVMFWALA